MVRDEVRQFQIPDFKTYGILEGIAAKFMESVTVLFKFEI
jgi:hypothetical protein